MIPETTPCKITATIQGSVRQLTSSLAAFRQKYLEWLVPLESAGPVYRLPLEAIEGLKKPPAGRRPIMSNGEAGAETAFFDLCQGSKAIGVWNEDFVHPSYMIRPDPLSEDMLRGLNWTRKQVQTARSLAGMTDSIAGRLKGYVGWLVSEPNFLRGRDELALRWHALPADERPYPIARSVRLPVPSPGARRARQTVVEFQQDLNEFLDLWGLMRMLTWDLPEPQGPLLPAPFAADSPAMPTHGLHLVLPIHYPLTGTDDLLRQIRQQQVYLARDLGVDTSMAGLPHFEVYGQMLEVDFLEMTIRSRYGRPRSPRGLVTVMEYVIAETMGLSEHQVKKLRKGIAACRAGKRSQVRWLVARN